MNPAQRALALLRADPALMEHCARNLYGHARGQLRSRERSRWPGWADLTGDQREVWRRRTLAAQRALADRSPDDGGPDGGGGEPAPHPVVAGEVGARRHAA